MGYQAEILAMADQEKAARNALNRLMNDIVTAPTLIGQWLKLFGEHKQLIIQLNNILSKMTREEVIAQLEKYDVNDLYPEIYTTIALHRLLRFCQMMSKINGATYTFDKRGPELIEEGCQGDPVDFKIVNYYPLEEGEPDITILLRNSGKIELLTWGECGTPFMSTQGSEAFPPECAFDDAFMDWVELQVYASRKF